MTETIIQWLERLWGVTYYEANVYADSGYNSRVLHYANSEYFIQAASAITVVAFIAIIALFFMAAAFLGRHRR